MRTILLLISIACLGALAHNADEKAAQAIFNAARTSVNPPCDYRARDSPCNGQQGNKMPSLSWSNELVQMSRDFAALCPSQSNLNLPANIGQLWIASTHIGDTRTAGQMLRAYATLWSTPRGYDAATGVARGPHGRAYKQVINAQTREVGCAVNLNCDGGQRAVVCTFRRRPEAGPAYPSLSLDATLRDVFKRSLIVWINRARTHAFPRPKTALQPLEWDDALARSAQESADRQAAFPGVYDERFADREIIFAKPWIVANPAFLYVARSFSRGVLYRRDQNLCASWRGQPRNQCGFYTQIVGQDVRKVGCGLSWKNGNTFTVCHYDKSYSRKGEHTIQPF